MNDTAAPARANRRRLFIGLGAAATLVIALAAGLFLSASSADGKVSDYNDDYAAWKTKNKPLLLAATKAVPTGTYLVKDITTDEGFAKQDKGCAAVTSSRKSVAKAADRLPTMGDNGLLARVSSGYSDAADRSDRRKKVVAAYASAASKALTQIERDCRWNITYNTSTVKPGKAYEKSGTYLLQPGDTEPAGVVCASDVTCISSIDKKQRAYADLRLEYVALSRSGSLVLYGEKCEATSYGDACKIIKKSFDHILTVEKDVYTRLRTVETNNNPTIRDEFVKIQKAREKYAPEIKEAVLALDPALKEDKRVRDYPDWTDAFFIRADALLLGKLKDERAAIEKL